MSDSSGRPSASSSGKLVIGVAGFQGDIEENLAAAQNALKQLGLDGEVISVRYPEEIEQVDALILPGGESTVISTLAAIHSSLPAIRSRISEGLPVLGTCAGMIMLSTRAFDRVVGETKQKLIGGLDIVVERNAFGRQSDSFETDLDMPSLGKSPFKAVFIRAPAVSDVGSGVQIIAKLDGRPVAVRQKNLIGTSFHPELSDDTRIHEELVRMAAAFHESRLKN